MIEREKLFPKPTANKKLKSGIKFQTWDKEHLKSNLIGTLTKNGDQQLTEK